MTISNDRITVGALVMPFFGDMHKFRLAWLEAERLGADGVFVADHFLIPRDAEYRREGVPDRPASADPAAQLEPKTFEAVSVQAAIAATTTRVKIGAAVLCGAWRNPDLLADMARTIDHVAGGGRYVLGLGAGYVEREFREYGYEFESARARWDQLDAFIPRIRRRWSKLTPAPAAPIPIMIGAKGERVALRVAARHADIWHCFGSPDLLAHKSAIVDRWCEVEGRNPKDVRRSTSYNPLAAYEWDPEACYRLGFRDFLVHIPGPDWPMTELAETLAWRNERADAAPPASAAGA